MTDRYAKWIIQPDDDVAGHRDHIICIHATGTNGVALHEISVNQITYGVGQFDRKAAMDVARLIAAAPTLLAENRKLREALDQAWMRINAEGGIPKDKFDQGYLAAINQCLDIIEDLGGVDPLARAALKETDNG